MSAHEEDGNLVCPVCEVTFDIHEVMSPECKGEEMLPIGIIGGVGFNLWDKEDEMKAETGHSTTTEPTHCHLCGVCGGVWSHADETCDGPQLPSQWYLRATQKFDCPACVDDGGAA